MEKITATMQDRVEQELVVTRVLDASREQVFKAWAEAEHLRHWWGPKGFALKVVHLDFRPGGTFHYRIEAANGLAMWGKFVYQEIEAPGRIVYISSFSDEEGTTTRSPFSQTWPLEVFNTLTLSEEEGQTILTLRSFPLQATEEERQTFDGMHKALQQGFKGTLDQLADYLAKA